MSRHDPRDPGKETVKLGEIHASDPEVLVEGYSEGKADGGESMGSPVEIVDSSSARTGKAISSRLNK